MTKRREHSKSERGQMLAVVAVSAVALIAMGAFAMDVGAWIRTHRATQSVADASALAGAQALPVKSSDATELAGSYSGKNGGGLTEIRFESRTFPQDTIFIGAERTSPGFLSRVLGIASVSVKADAAARAYNMGSAKYVGPFAVWEGHPYVRGSAACPCLGDNFVTTIELDSGRPSLGAFKIINVDGSRGGLGQSTLSDWILKGLDAYMGPGWYYSDPGAKYNPDQIEDAVEARIGSEILVPVYRSVREQGAGYEYDVIGWIAFHILAFTKRGANGALTGYFTSAPWEGIPTESAKNYFGAKVIKLIG